MWRSGSDARGSGSGTRGSRMPLKRGKGVSLIVENCRSDAIIFSTSKKTKHEIMDSEEKKRLRGVKHTKKQEFDSKMGLWRPGARRASPPGGAGWTAGRTGVAPSPLCIPRVPERRRKEGPKKIGGIFPPNLRIPPKLRRNGSDPSVLPSFFTTSAAATTATSGTETPRRLRRRDRGPARGAQRRLPWSNLRSKENPNLAGTSRGAKIPGRRAVP